MVSRLSLQPCGIKSGVGPGRTGVHILVVSPSIFFPHKDLQFTSSIKKDYNIRPNSKPTIMLTFSRIAVLSTLLLSLSALTSPALDGPAAASDIQARDALLALRQNIVYCGGRLSLPSSNRIRLAS